MTTYSYKIIDREPYLTAISKGEKDTLEIRVLDAEDALMRIGKASAKIANGVGRVKLSALCEGVFTPEIIFKDKTVALYPIRYEMGKISLAYTEDICAILGARAYEVKMRVSEIEKQLRELEEAIRGKAIF